jgi:hypothetical protein
MSGDLPEKARWDTAAGAIKAPAPAAVPYGYIKISTYLAFGLIGTALSKKISVFQSSYLKVVPISPNASYRTERDEVW